MGHLKVLLLSMFMILIIQPKIMAANGESSPELFRWPVPKGEIINWETASKILPLGSRFQVIDVDTGLTFKVQRRAGSKHADVQPLTRNDTNIMKIIYKGKWSWERNDVVIKVKDKYIAASMNGMPHGYGALQNGFPGHFCIHFQGSTTHKGKSLDLAHHLMISKAAGELDDFTSRLTPKEIVQAYEIGINHEEGTILKHILLSEKNNPLKKFKYMRLDIGEKDSQSSSLFVKRINGIARVQTVNSNELQKIHMNFLLVRDSVLNQWRIANVSY